MFWKKKPAGTTIFYATDLHGSSVCFKKFINAPKFYATKGQRIDVLIMGGDLTGKLIVPVIKENSTYRSYLFGKERILKTQEELADFTKTTEVLGAYANIFEPDEYREFKENPATQDALFQKLMLQRLSEWMDFAEQRLKDTGVACYVSPGNDDIKEVRELLEDSPAVYCPDRKVVQINDDHEMLSLGNANITPFECPGDLPEEELARKIDHISTQVSDMENCIFNLHCPPYGTIIDDAPDLDEDLRPQVGISGVEMGAVGCRAVRDSIEHYQPLLGLHGHIHESRGSIQLGRTICLNPGSEYSEGILRAVFVSIRKGEVLSHLFASG
jgi:Icc-related predicted phosphoesterase